MATKYDSSVNVLGSIPDYSSMIDFICEYCGRASEGQGSFSFRTHKTFSRFLVAIDVLALLHHIKETEPGEFTWSEATLKICASKYLTILKKLNLADGAIKKQILYPPITSSLFAYFIKMAMTVYPDQKTLDNPMMAFSFYDKTSLISKLKRVEYVSLWNISQVGEEVVIEVKSEERRKTNSIV